MAPGNEGRGQSTTRQRDLKTSETTKDREVILGKWVYKVKLGPSGQFNKYKARYVTKISNKRKDWTTLRLWRLPVSQRNSGF